MNTYEITFERENGTTGSDRFTAATEAQARRDFNEVYRHGNGKITSIELVSENATATKEQERKALAKIKKIVEELGEGCYIGVAFAGCFEIAESNIENDFADSMKHRWEHAENQLKKAEAEVSELKRGFSESYTEWSEASSADKETIKNLQEHAVNADDLETLLSLVIERITALDCEVQNATERIVESAGEPESAAFKNAVSDHRAAKRAADKYKTLLERVSKAKQ